MNIILTDIANFSVFILPIVPDNIQIISGGNSTTYNGIEHQFTIIDNEKPKEIGWSSFFPVNKSYGFVPRAAYKNGWVYISFIELMKKYNYPIRVIFTTKTKVPILNSLVSIENFTYSVDNSGDINYSIKLKEFYEKFYNFFATDKKIVDNFSTFQRSQFAKDNLEKFGLLKAR